MRLLSILSLTALLSAPAFAADLGTYRPGTPYQSVIAPGADVCESHCAGDAQCRGWNFVKANPKVPGVCEFISNISSPVASQISISGLAVNASLISNRVKSGGANTVRVGTTVAPKPLNSVTRVGNRTVVRQPVPQQVAPQTAATRRVVAPAAGSLTAQQNQYRHGKAATQPAPQQASQRLMRDPRIVAPQRPQQPRPQMQQPSFQPMLDAPQGQMPQQQMPQRQMPPQHMQQQPRPQQQGYAPQLQRPQMQRRAPARQRGQSTRPGVTQPIAPQPQRAAQAPRPTRPMPRASANAPVTHQNAPDAMARMQQAQQGLTAAQVQQSLYGSLYDDVNVPAENAPMPTDPNAPIPTANSRPTQPIMVDGLAGPARR